MITLAEALYAVLWFPPARVSLLVIIGQPVSGNYTDPGTNTGFCAENCCCISDSCYFAPWILKIMVSFAQNLMLNIPVGQVMVFQ